MGSVATNRSQRSGSVSALLRVPVNLWLVIALMAMSFGAGVIVRTMAEPQSQQVTPQSQFSQILAPPLSDQQISQGTLPSGHPDLSGAGDGQNGGNGGGNQGSGK